MLNRGKKHRARGFRMHNSKVKPDNSPSGEISGGQWWVLQRLHKMTESYTDE
jgi:hypothetical protein